MLQCMFWCETWSEACVCLVTNTTFMLTLAGGMGLQVQIACVQALLKVSAQLEDTGGFFSLLDEHQELLLEAPAAAVQELWLTAQAAAALPALAGFERELLQRVQTWQVCLRSLLWKLSISIAWHSTAPRLSLIRLS